MPAQAGIHVAERDRWHEMDPSIRWGDRLEVPMPTVLITGANRGIGLEFARQYAADGWEVIATARRSSPELDSLGVTVKPLDLSDADAVAAFSVDRPPNLFIANAGTSQPKETQGADTARDWQAMMLVNAIAPFQLGLSLIPRMAEGAKMIAISSGLGSIGDNKGRWVPYRTSKAALNMAWTSLAHEAYPQGIACFLLSPGWVKTDMGGAGAEISAAESVSDMRALIERLTLADSGRFLRRDGSPLPW
jgi:NAD(P)-dependent dehydrogenase (short-subunit alcohol dehydrogenase family)